MRLISYILLSYFLSQSITYGRTPSIPLEIDGLLEKICEYKNLEEARPNTDLTIFISLFENMYNTNQIDDIKVKAEVFCLLKKFYEKDDPYFAEEFSRDMPNTSCTL
ncbi:hypothetical protein [Halobacteriovorax sp.]|uniref:hypothetical protein n=1 Tax=Halobacteriovorax sp. TaxID=2020862 RepID=UPI0035689E1E